MENLLRYSPIHIDNAVKRRADEFARKNFGKGFLALTPDMQRKIMQSVEPMVRQEMGAPGTPDLVMGSDGTPEAHLSVTGMGAPSPLTRGSSLPMSDRVRSGPVLGAPPPPLQMNAMPSAPPASRPLARPAGTEGIDVGPAPTKGDGGGYNVWQRLLLGAAAGAMGGSGGAALLQRVQDDQVKAKSRSESDYAMSMAEHLRQLGEEDDARELLLRTASSGDVTPAAAQLMAGRAQEMQQLEGRKALAGLLRSAYGDQQIPEHVEAALTAMERGALGPEALKMVTPSSKVQEVDDQLVNIQQHPLTGEVSATPIPIAGSGSGAKLTSEQALLAKQVLGKDVRRTSDLNQNELQAIQRFEETAAVNAHVAKEMAKLGAFADVPIMRINPSMGKVPVRLDTRRMDQNVTGNDIAEGKAVLVSPDVWRDVAQLHGIMPSMLRMRDAAQRLLERRPGLNLLQAAKLAVEQRLATSADLAAFQAALGVNRIAVAAIMNRGRPTEKDAEAVAQAFPKLTDTAETGVAKLDALIKQSNETIDAFLGMVPGQSTQGGRQNLGGGFTLE